MELDIFNWYRYILIHFFDGWARGAVNDDIDLVSSHIVYGAPSGVDLL